MNRRQMLLAAASPLLAVEPKPSLNIKLPGGKTVNTQSMVGNVCAVTIFKTTCPHCQRSLPIMEKMVKEYGPKGFKAIAAAVDTNPEPLVLDFAKNFKITYPLGWASIDDICKFMDLKPEQLYVPGLMVFDRRGKLRGRYPGGDAFFNMEEANLRNLLEMLLKEPKKS